VSIAEKKNWTRISLTRKNKALFVLLFFLVSSRFPWSKVLSSCHSFLSLSFFFDCSEKGEKEKERKTRVRGMEFVGPDIIDQKE